MQIQLDFTLVSHDREVPATRDLSGCGKVLADAGLEHQAHARGFYVQGSWDEVFQGLKRCQEEVLARSSDRLTAVIELGARADRQDEVGRAGKPRAETGQTPGGSGLRPSLMNPPPGEPSLPDGLYRLVERPPDAESFCRLRELNGLTVRSEEAARRGLAQSLFGCHRLFEETTVGMGRVIGDGGCWYHLVDLAVLPEHRGKGLGHSLFKCMVDFVVRDAPATARATLFADGETYRIYEKFGFRFSAPYSRGMILQL